MEISADTSLVLNIGTLVACGFFLRRLSSNIKKFQTEVEMELKLHDDKFDKLEKLDLDNLEIGDIILGRAIKLTKGINHIMFYVGEGYIVHCTRGNFLGKEENEYRDGVVKEKLTSNYYTEIETQENIEKGNITKRFDDKIYVIRFKENKDN